MQKSYSLLDSGNFRKLEKFGDFILSRPDPQAIWKKGLPDREWAKADAIFDKSWEFNNKLPKSWIVEIADLKFKINLGNFKHVGVFPEHVPNWQWISEQLKIENSKLKILNLFGYTGGATLAAAKAGAEVVHVDASKVSISTARENAELSGLKSVPIRWIEDDCLSFLKREVKRQEKGSAKYDGIILDPPSFGRGAKGEVWKIEENLLPLLEKCKEILAESGFLLLNGYAEGFSKMAYGQILASVFEVPLEKIEIGELSIKEESERRFNLPAGIFARFAN